MLYFRKTLLISALAISLAACSTTPETQNSPTLSTDSPSPNSVTTPNIQGKQFAQEIQLVEPLKTGNVGETIKIPINLNNTSNFVWDSAVANPVNLSYHWTDSSGTIVVFEGERTPLPKSLAPQESVDLNATVKLPDQPGNYTLTLTMVQEGVTWFNNAGAEAQNIPVTVTAQ